MTIKSERDFLTVYPHVSLYLFLHYIVYTSVYIYMYVCVCVCVCVCAVFMVFIVLMLCVCICVYISTIQAVLGHPSPHVLSPEEEAEAALAAMRQHESLQVARMEEAAAFHRAQEARLKKNKT